MNSVATTAPAGVFKKLTMRDAAVLLALAWLIPFLVHLVPWSGARPIGAYLLPVFWATFLAVYFYGVTGGLLTGLFAPVVNLLVTGLPAWRFFGTMSLELVLFVLVTAWAVRQAPRFWLWAPLGYGVAKTVAALLLSAPAVVDMDATGYFFTHLVVGGAAGLVVLTLINGALVKFYPKDPAPRQGD
jgi:glucan phosphoethanolaminetransferase (alkaline phosphatase superfamily)